MEEKILKNKNHGMAVMLIFAALYLIAVIAVILLSMAHLAAVGNVILIICAVYCFVGWIPFFGLKVLKPQEAMVLTLFGRY